MDGQVLQKPWLAGEAAALQTQLRGTPRCAPRLRYRDFAPGEYTLTVKGRGLFWNRQRARINLKRSLQAVRTESEEVYPSANLAKGFVPERTPPCVINIQ